MWRNRVHHIKPSNGAPSPEQTFAFAKTFLHSLDYLPSEPPFPLIQGDSYGLLALALLCAATPRRQRRQGRTGTSKSDVHPQWLRQWQRCGLLNASFRPEDIVCRLRSLHRYRDTLPSRKRTGPERLPRRVPWPQLRIGKNCCGKLATKGNCPQIDIQD